MSPLRITTLVVAAVLTAASIITLVDHAIKGNEAALPELLTLVLACSSLASWISLVALTVRDSVCDRLREMSKLADRRIDATDKRVDERSNEIAGQLAAIAEMVGEYGDQREGHGYLAGVRDTSTSGHLTRVK